MKIIFTLLMCLAPICASAQTSFAQNVYVNISTEAMMKSKDYEGIGANFQLGYKIIPSLYAFADFDGGALTYEKDGLKNHSKLSNLGGGLGYRFFLNDTGLSSIDLKASITTTLGDVDWKSTNYKAGAYLRLSSSKVAPQIGLGYVYCDSRTNGISSRGHVFASIGFSF